MKTDKLVNQGAEIVYHIRGEFDQAVLIMGRPPLCGSYYLDAPHRQGLFDRLNQAGWAVALFDPAGLWQSGQADRYDLNRWVSDLAAVVQALPHKKLALWGTTLASWPVLDYARRPDAGVDRIVLEWPVLFFSGPGGFASARDKGDGYRHAEELRAPTVEYFMEMEKVYEDIYGTETMLRFARRLAEECNKPGAAVYPYFRSLVEAEPNDFLQTYASPVAIPFSDPSPWGDAGAIRAFGEKIQAALLLERPLAPWDDDDESFSRMLAFLE